MTALPNLPVSRARMSSMAPAESGLPDGFPSMRFQTGQAYKVHRSYIFMGPMVVFAVLAIGLLNGSSGIAELFVALKRAGVDVPAFIVVALGLIALVVLYALLVGVYVIAYRNLSYVFDEREFSLYSGIFVKKRVHVPYARVQSVNQKAGVLQRIVGVCTIHIDTAGGAQNKAVRVPYVTLEVAESIRSELFLRKAVEAGMSGVAVAAAQSVAVGAAVEGRPQAQQQAWGGAAVPGAAVTGAPLQSGAGVSANVLDSTVGEVADWRGLFGGQVAGFEPVAFEMGLDNREMLLTSFSHSMPFVLALIMGLTALGSVLPMALMGAFTAAFSTMLSVGIVLASTVVSWLLGAAGVAISYGKFRVCRRGSRVEVERGLLQRSFSGIDVERIQSIEIRQGFVRRLLGYCEISLGRIAAATGNSSGNSQKDEVRGLVIHPFAKVDQVDDILQALIPEYTDRPQESQLQTLPPVARRRCLLRRCVWYNPAAYLAILLVAGWAVFSVASAFSVGGSAPAMPLDLMAILSAVVFAICVAVTLPLAASAMLWARDSRYAWNDHYVVIRNGGLGSVEVCIPRKKIQCGATRSNPFQRRLGLTSLLATTAAGQHNTTTRLLDIPDDAGRRWLSWMRPRTGGKAVS